MLVGNETDTLGFWSKPVVSAHEATLLLMQILRYAGLLIPSCNMLLKVGQLEACLSKPELSISKHRKPKITQQLSLQRNRLLRQSVWGFRGISRKIDVLAWQASENQGGSKWKFLAILTCLRYTTGYERAGVLCYDGCPGFDSMSNRIRAKLRSYK